MRNWHGRGRVLWLETVRVKIIFQTIGEVIVHMLGFLLPAWFIIEILNALIPFITLIPFHAFVTLVPLVPVTVWIIVRRVAHNALIPLVPLVSLIPLVAVVINVVDQRNEVQNPDAAVQPPTALAVPASTPLRESAPWARLNTPAQPRHAESAPPQPPRHCDAQLCCGCDSGQCAGNRTDAVASTCAPRSRALA